MTTRLLQALVIGALLWTGTVAAAADPPMPDQKPSDGWFSALPPRCPVTVAGLAAKVDGETVALRELSGQLLAAAEYVWRQKRQDGFIVPPDKATLLDQPSKPAGTFLVLFGRAGCVVDGVAGLAAWATQGAPPPRPHPAVLRSGG